MKPSQIRHIHDLPVLRKYVWNGDMGWAVRRVGLASSSLGPYLGGFYSPRHPKLRLVWRRLAKVQNNKAFEAKWQQGGHEMPSVKALEAACGALHICDKTLWRSFLGNPLGGYRRSSLARSERVYLSKALLSPRRSCFGRSITSCSRRR